MSIEEVTCPRCKHEGFLHANVATHQLVCGGENCDLPFSEFNHPDYERIAEAYRVWIGWVLTPDSFDEEYDDDYDDEEDYDDDE